MTDDVAPAGAADRLYSLLPAVYRQRDADQGFVLRALLRLMDEQLTVVADDIAQLYDDWFIETCSDWVVPYIGELVGFVPAHDAAEPPDPSTAEGRARSRILYPRRDVAHTIGDRRRRGAFTLLATVVSDVSGLPARAVEFARLLDLTQSLAHLRLDRGRVANLRDGDALDRLGGAFESTAHLVDVRRLSRRSALGRYNLPSVGVFAWRLHSHSVTMRQPYAQEAVGPQFYTFSVLGNDQPLFGGGAAEAAWQPDEVQVPARLSRRVFERALDRLYGEGRPVQIWWVPPGGTAAAPAPRMLVPRERILVADLTDWAYRTPRGRVAVDPVSGRIAFPPAGAEQPRRGIWVSYRHGFPADIGGGEYDRPVAEPAADAALYRVGEGGSYRRLGDALGAWRAEQPDSAVIEFLDSTVYVEPVTIDLAEGQSLALRAAAGAAPVLRLLDWQTEQSDAVSIVGAAGSCFTIDGLLVTGRGIRIAGELAHLRITHCTLVPGWGLHPDCEPRRPNEPSLEIDNVDAAVTVDHSILGTIRVYHDEVERDPVPVELADSILDATSDDRDAVGTTGPETAHVVLTLRRCTVIGEVRVHAVALAENSIITGLLRVARRQVGCIRFSWVVPGSRTPRRYHCQPELAVQALLASPAPGTVTVLGRDEAARAEQLRVRPDFTSVRYGSPAYCQLAATCADEIRTGADDSSEMGAYHDLFQPQRDANIAARLSDNTPSDADAAVIYVN